MPVTPPLAGEVVSNDLTAASGQSGAVVQINGDIVRKYSEPGAVRDRLIEQGSWLQRHHTSQLVRVLGMQHDGYTMPRLNPLDIDDILDIGDVCDLALEIRWALTNGVWSHPPEVEVNWDAHQSYVYDRTEEWAPHALEAIMTMSNDTSHNWHRDLLQECLIHGDPTFSNTMVNPHEDEYVLIDPLPADDRMPSLRAVDLGKITQSLLGYEVIRFGWPLLPVKQAVAMGQLRRMCEDEHEFEAARYFAAVHYVRLLPYAPSSYRPRLTQILDGICGL